MFGLTILKNTKLIALRKHKIIQKNATTKKKLTNLPITVD